MGIRRIRTEQQSRHQELVASLSVDLEYRHVCSGGDDEEDEEDSCDGHINANFWSSAQLPYLMLIRPAIVLLLLLLRHIGR